jgi:hypothetical protein
MPAHLLRACRLKTLLCFGLAVNGAIGYGALGVFPLIRLLAGFSQIDDFAHYEAPVMQHAESA